VFTRCKLQDKGFWDEHRWNNWYKASNQINYLYSTGRRYSEACLECKLVFPSLLFIVYGLYSLFILSPFVSDKAVCYWICLQFIWTFCNCSVKGALNSEDMSGIYMFTDCSSDLFFILYTEIPTWPVSHRQIQGNPVMILWEWELIVICFTYTVFDFAYICNKYLLSHGCPSVCCM